LLGNKQLQQSAHRCLGVWFSLAQNLFFELSFGFRKLRWLWWLGLLGLCGCGFHFSGYGVEVNHLPDMNISTQLPSVWQQRLYRFLKTRNVQVYPSADLLLKITDFSEIKRPISLNSRAKVAEYSIEFRMTIELIGSREQIILPRTELTSTRIYRFNEQQVPGKQAEEAFLKQAMADELFDQMLRYVQVSLPSEKAD